MVSLLALPLQASADYCTHPKLDPLFSDHGYDTGFYQHREWYQDIFQCLSCGAEVIKPIKYEDWEDHDWDIDWAHPDNMGAGLVAYEACCKICNYHDTLYNP